MVRQPLSKSGNKYLRKFRKWPHSPYKTGWHLNFAEQQALLNLNNVAASLLSSPSSTITHRPSLLSTLIHSFTSYNTHPTPNAFFFLIKILTQRPNFHHDIPHVLHHIEHFQHFQTPEFIILHLLRFYAFADRHHDAVDLFYRIPSLRCTPTVCSLNLLLSLLCRNREWLRMVPQILLHSQKMNIRLDESTFRVLIEALCRTKRVDHAVQIVNYMVEDGYCLDDRMSSLILSSLCELKGLTGVEVLDVWHGVRKQGFCPSLLDYTNLMRFLVNQGKGMDALDILNQMKDDGMKPNVVCYTIVMKGVVAKGDYVKLDELFEEMLVLGLIPDVYAYNVYINGLCKQNNVDDALKIVASMEELGSKPNVVTYNTILGALCLAVDLSKASGLVKEMRFKGIGLNLHTYRILLDGLVGKAEIEEARILLEEMLNKCFYPKSSTFDNIILQMCQKGLVTEALELMKKVAMKSFSPPGARAWEALLLNSRSELTYSQATFADLLSPE